MKSDRCSEEISNPSSTAADGEPGYRYMGSSAAWVAADAVGLAALVT